MVFIYVCLLFLQVVGFRAVNGYDSNELSKDQISKFIIPLLDSKARKNDIKVQVVPYFNYKSNKKDGNKKTVKLGPARDSKSKKDLPVAVLLTEPKYRKRANKVSDDAHDYNVKDQDFKVKLRSLAKTPYWESGDDTPSDKNSQSDSSLTIELFNKGKLSRNGETILDESSGSKSEDSASYEFVENESDQQRYGPQNIDSAEKSSADSDSDENTSQPHKEDIHVINGTHNVLKSISKSNKTQSQKHKNIDNIIKIEHSSEKIILHGDTQQNKSHNDSVPHDDSDNSTIIKHKQSDDNTRSGKSSEELESDIHNILKPLQNNSRSDLYKRSHLKVLYDSDTEPMGLTAHNDSLIRSASEESPKKLEELQELILLKPLQIHEHSQIDQQNHNVPLVSSDHELFSIHNQTDNNLREGKSDDSKPNENATNQSKEHESSQTNEHEDGVSIISSSDQLVNTNINSLDNSENLDVSDSLVQSNQNHQENMNYNESPSYINDGNSSVQHYGNSLSGSQYDLSESISKSGENVLEDITPTDSKSDLSSPVAKSLEDINVEIDKDKDEGLGQTHIYMREVSEIPELDLLPVAFVKGGEVKKQEVSRRSGGTDNDDIQTFRKILNPIGNDYPKVNHLERSGRNHEKETDFKDQNGYVPTVSPPYGASKDEFEGKQILEVVKSYIKKAHELHSKSYNLSFLFNKR